MLKLQSSGVVQLVEAEEVTEEDCAFVKKEQKRKKIPGQLQGTQKMVEATE